MQHRYAPTAAAIHIDLLTEDPLFQYMGPLKVCQAPKRQSIRVSWVRAQVDAM